MGQQLFVNRSMREYFFHGDRFLETDPTGQRNGVNLNMFFLDMNSFHPLVVSQFPSGNHKRLDNPCSSNYSDNSPVEENGPKGWFFENDGEIPVKFHDLLKDFVFQCINRPVPRVSLSPY